MIENELIRLELCSNTATLPDLCPIELYWFSDIFVCLNSNKHTFREPLPGRVHDFSRRRHSRYIHAHLKHAMFCLSTIDIKILFQYLTRWCAIGGYVMSINLKRNSLKQLFSLSLKRIHRFQFDLLANVSHTHTHTTRALFTSRAQTHYSIIKTRM